MADVCQAPADVLGGFWSVPRIQPRMANNPAGTKLGAASHPQILFLQAVLFKGRRSLQLACRRSAS
jgi:hypothetical protein